ncbi:MAG: RNA polymerase-binding protein DksA [Rhizobiaceae bacterium]
MAAKTKEYKPHDNEKFMGVKQQKYFRKKLEDWKADIQQESADTLETLQEHNLNAPDITDRATSETDRSIELRSRDRHRKLVSKIDKAIKRIDDGEYGYCEDTGEPINLQRLDARPIATMSVEAQERHERREKIYRDE